MTRRTAFLCLAVFIAAATGCYTGSAVDANRPPNPPDADTDPTDPTGGNRPGTTPVNDAPTGIPCDVAAFLRTQCGSCHGETLSGGAPNRLVRWEDLSAVSESDPSQTVAQLSLARMRSTQRPMPPEGKLAEGAISAFAKWVTDGLPKGSCSAPIRDAGADAADGESPGPGPEEPTSICSSTKFTIDEETFATAAMRPGSACVACHKPGGDASRKPFAIAGTVYKTVREPINCNGVDGFSSDTKIRITDVSSGRTFEPLVNDVGNFFFRSRVLIDGEFTVQVVKGGKTRSMRRKLTLADGDCNSCHTENGANGAPGRIYEPTDL